MVSHAHTTPTSAVYGVTILTTATLSSVCIIQEASTREWLSLSKSIQKKYLFNTFAFYIVVAAPFLIRVGLLLILGASVFINCFLD